ncbi:MAG: hypothetical protein ACRD2U_05700 [Terriglobales bacterium]
MSCKPARVGFLSVAAGVLLLAIPSFGTQKPSAGKKPFGPQPAPVSQQEGPATPLPLDQIPAIAPQVSFRGGELTIVARNSSLGAILQQVQSQTGASMDMPGSPADRVVGQFGPGPAREVLASLLNGSHYNYVLLGSPQNPSVLNRVVLLAKSSAPASQTATNSPAVLTRPGVFSAPTENADDSDSQDNSSDMADSDQTATDQSDQANGDQSAQADGDQSAQPRIKTPQQLLEELQRQRQAQPGAPQQVQGGPPQ